MEVKIEGQHFVRFENSLFESYILSDDEIKKYYSTSKFKITDEFLEFLHKIEYLWKDESYFANYIITPMKNILIGTRYDRCSNEEKMVLFRNYTQPLILDLLYRMATEQNIICTLKGDTGSGKSYLTIFVEWLINKFVNNVLKQDSKFGVENICFNRSEIIDLVPKLNRFESCHFDEDNEAILGVGAFQQWSLIKRFQRTLRSMQNNFFNLSPQLTDNEDHYIIECLGVNADLSSNKAIFRERGFRAEGFFIGAMDKGRDYQKLISDYKVKKKKFQEDLKHNVGDENRFNRMCEMAVATIKKYELTYKMKNAFAFCTAADFKLDTKSQQELKRIMEMLLDNRVNIPQLKLYKSQVFAFISKDKVNERNGDSEED